MRRPQVWAPPRLLCGVALVGVLALLGRSSPVAADDRLCFAESGQCVGGRFRDYWLANGGLAAFGYVVSAEGQEKLGDHQVRTVQYFERVRFEYHPENAPPYDVLLGQLGRYYHLAEPPAAARAAAAYFPETGHTLGGAFRAYWEANGGLATFGFPLSEELPPGVDATTPVQWFERGRLELHPENAPPYDVLPTRLGAQLMIAREDRGGPGITPRPGLFAPDEPAFGEAEVRRFLEDWWDTHPDAGCPSGPGTPVRSCPPPLFPPRGTIAAVEFMTSYAFGRRVPTWQSFIDEQLLCVVTLRYPGSDRPTYLIFDAHSGKGGSRIGG